jgi:ribosomal protein S18 acetylase RimI-like enzyme
MKFKTEIPTETDLVAMIKLYQKSWLDIYASKENGVSKDWVKERTDAWFMPEKQIKRKKALQDQITHPDTQYIRIVRETDKIIAIIHCSKKEEQHMDALYVDTKFHGTGLAYQLMDEAMKWLDLMKSVSLEVASYNQRAINFYRKYGFEIIKGSDHLYADKIPTVDMIRKGK